DYSASSGSISGGAGGKMNGWDAKEGTTAPRGGPGMPMSESGSDSSSTLATLTEGNITIGGKQTTAAELGINTDASAAHRALEALPDASKLLADQQAMAGAIGTVVSTSQQIANDIGSGANRITDKYREGMSVEERRVFDDLPSDEQFNRLKVFDPSYPEALVTQQKWAPDGVYGRALGAVTTALVGGMSGQGLGQLGSNALAPYAAELIGKTFDPNKQSAVPSEAMQMLSHALLGALLAEANGGSAGSGALAAGGGELAAKFLGDYYAKQNKGQLTPEQVAQVGALGQAVGVLAGSIAGDELFGVALGANLAKNSVDNNYLDAKQLTALAEEREECKGNEACENSASERWAKVSKLQGKEMWATCQLADGACDLQFAQAWAYGKTDVGHLGLGLDQATSKELVMRFLETAAGKPYRGGTGSFFLQMGKGAVDTASELVTGGLGYALALGDLAFAPQYHRDPATGEFKYERMIVGTPFFGDTSGNPIEAGGYKIGNLAGVDLALFGAAWKSGKVATAKPGGAAAGIGSAGDPAKLRTQLIAEEIAAGHAFEKHVLVQGEFAGLGVRTRKQFAEHIESVVSNPSSIRYYADARVVYLQESTKTVVFRNPAAEGTAFRPADWNDYISKLPKRTDPPGTGGK
ncbi:MAG: VENN motif pre-toxin domain-containing protein, partial [Stenotrophomonas lactitubi]|uniref:VENN motif pre-toxin domain-containing protein n=1 Tax=Stenotrophomonas lactitubi TaxID=2045214 RepID=UPI003D0D345C